jgi:NitT/TauT family transport system substrate-binding protein
MLLVTGCQFFGSGGSAAEPTGSGTVTVAAAPGVANAPLFVGITKGLFSQAGLDVRVIPASSIKAELNDLASGHADIAFGDYADMFYAQKSKAANLSIVANGYNAAPSVMEVLTLPGSGINSAADLVGRNVGMAAPQEMPPTTPRHEEPDTLESIAAWSVLSADNVDPTQVHWTPMQTRNLVGALKVRRVAAILATEPTIYLAESQLGAVPVLDAGTGDTASLPLDGYFSTASWASKNSTNMAAFRAALQKAQGEANQSAPVQNALMNSAHMGVQTASLVTLGTYPTSLQAADLQRVANLMFLFNTFPNNSGTLEVSSMIPK